jgi:serine/threonine protein kinase
MSLQTKLHFMFSVAQALRYLRDYGIVHLDLKPENVMTYCNMLIKLIDFGESYHPDACDKSKLVHKQTTRLDLPSHIVVQKYLAALLLLLSQMYFQWE